MFGCEVMAVCNVQDCTDDAQWVLSSGWTVRATKELVGIVQHTRSERPSFLSAWPRCSLLSPHPVEYIFDFLVLLYTSEEPWTFSSYSLPGIGSCIFVSLVGKTEVRLFAALPALQSPENQ